MKELDYPYDSSLILSKRIKIKNKLLQNSDNCIRKRIAILGGFTTSIIKDLLEIFLLNYGISPEFYESEYGKYYEDAVFSNSELERFNPDLVYICTSVRNIQNFPVIQDSEQQIQEKIDIELTRLSEIWSSLYERFKCTIIQNNFEYPMYRMLGNMDASNIYGGVHFISDINRLIADEIEKRSYVYLCDINYISSNYGLREWYDLVSWYAFKFAMKPSAMVDLAFNVSNIIKAILGKNAKCLVLDLDNTLWGGVVGDDGVGNIEIGKETPNGQAYYDFQKFIKIKQQLGIILAVNSKNSYESFTEGINHPDNVLKEADFACVKANWEPKDINIQEIAGELNIGIDSMVFVDDNPAERLLVKESLPQVNVPDINKVTDYIKTIDGCGFFETVTISKEDMDRSRLYSDNVKRSNLKKKYQNYGEYLNALEMRATIKPFAHIFINRIAQLTNKSNQFNLTTRRYTQEELETTIGNEQYVTLYGRLEDRFGDNGIVSVVIGRIAKDTCITELWLMSCRVLKREMEYAMMDEYIAACKSKGVDKIIGRYIPTAKNAMVEYFYKDMGFELINESDGITEWQLELKDAKKYNRYISMKEEENYES